MFMTAFGKSYWIFFIYSYSFNFVKKFILSCQDVLIRFLTTDEIKLNVIDAEDPEVCKALIVTCSFSYAQA